jgi:HSP20 family molecular chaperone IbpA
MKTPKETMARLELWGLKDFDDWKVEVDKDCYIITKDLPGIKAEDIKVNLYKSHVTVEALRHHKDKESTPYSFKYTPGVQIDANKTIATIKDGVFVLTFVAKRPDPPLAEYLPIPVKKL